jgi:hypothetical protein
MGLPLLFLFSFLFSSLQKNSFTTTIDILFAKPNLLSPTLLCYFLEFPIKQIAFQGLQFF